MAPGAPIRMAFFDYEFEATVEHHDLGTYRYTVVFLPEDIARELPLAEHPRLRISGEIDDAPLTGAWQPSRGRWYLMLGKPLLKAAGLAVGSMARVRFRVERQDEVDVPSVLAHAIAAAPACAKRWHEMSPGKQRALAQRVLSAKTAPTRARRVAEVIDWIERGETDLRRLGQSPR